MILSPKNLTIFGGIWLLRLGGQCCYWHLVVKGQGCRWTVSKHYRRQPPLQQFPPIFQSVNSVEVEQPWLWDKLNTPLLGTSVPHSNNFVVFKWSTIIFGGRFPDPQTDLRDNMPKFKIIFLHQKKEKEAEERWRRKRRRGKRRKRRRKRWWGGGTGRGGERHIFIYPVSFIYAWIHVATHVVSAFFFFKWNTAYS